MFCNKCGAQNPDDAAFCNGCGNPLGQSNISSAGSASVPTAIPINATASSPAIGGAIPGTSVPQVPAVVARQSRKPLVIGGIAAIVVILIIIFGVVAFTGGANEKGAIVGDGLKPGLYSVSTGSGSLQTVDVGEDGILTVISQGHRGTFAYSQDGVQEDSIIYDLKLETLDKIEVEYDNSGYILNSSDFVNRMWSGGNLKRLDCKLMVPKKGTYGEIAGEWGFRGVAETSDGTNYFVSYANVDEDGSARVFLDRGNGSNVPEMKSNQLIADDARETDASWHEMKSGAFILSPDSRGVLGGDITICFPMEQSSDVE